MDYYRKIAIIVGVLFIIYTSVDILSFLFTGPVTATPVTATNYLVSVSENRGLVGTGALLLFIGGACASGIAISLYPVLKKFNAGLALGAVGFRISEGVLRFVAVCAMLSIITLSQQFVKAGAPDSSYFQALGELLRAGRDLVNHVAMILAQSLGGLMFYYIFYQAKLVPRWLSGWGFAGATLTILASFLVMFHLIGIITPIYIVLNLPVALQEMVLAVWLIVKGFNPSAFAFETSKTAY